MGVWEERRCDHDQCLIYWATVSSDMLETITYISTASKTTATVLQDSFDKYTEHSRIPMQIPAQGSNKAYFKY